MEFQQIQELIKLLNDSTIGEFKLEQEDIKLSIRTKHFFDISLLNKLNAQPVNYAAPLTPLVQTAASANPVVQTVAPAANAGASKPAEGGVAVSDKLVTVKSPMIGTFYRSSSPDKPPYIKVGDEITPGKVLCVIEAMKLFNEIEAEISGRIVKLLVDDAAPVEFDQPLFMVEPI